MHLHVKPPQQSLSAFSHLAPLAKHARITSGRGVMRFSVAVEVSAASRCMGVSEAFSATQRVGQSNDRATARVSMRVMGFLQKAIMWPRRTFGFPQPKVNLFKQATAKFKLGH